jgi:hypothetical protein
VLACGFFAMFSPHQADATPGSAILSWTAPGDDAMAGRAQAYIVRYSLAPLNAANFSSGRLVTGVPAPKPPGTVEALRVQGLTAGTRYYFGIISTDDGGNWSNLSNIVSTAAATTGVGDAPTTLEFYEPWPNPARQSAHCAFTLPEAAMVQVEVFDVTGRLRRTMDRGWREAGRTELDWDLRDESGRRVAAGIYLVRARLGDRAWTKRIVVAS